MPWFHERSSNKFSYLTWWWEVTDASELSQPFTKISLLHFTRSKGSGNETLRELWQKERWMTRKWKGLVACSSSLCTDSGGAVWEGTLIVLASSLPGRGMNSPMQHLTQETARARGTGCQTGAEYVTLPFQHIPTAPPPCCPGNSFLPSSAFVLTRKFCGLHVLSIWWSSCKLYHHHTYFTGNINDTLFSCVLSQDNNCSV